MEHRQWVSRYRDELKGMAILWIVFFHSHLYLPGQWDLLRGFGYGGVDIFLFLMGMGLYRSLQRQEDLRVYATRRLGRILPAYLPVLVAWMAVMYPDYALSPVQALRGIAGNLSMVGFWVQTPKLFNWYAGAQFLFYLLAPLFFAVLAHGQRPVWALLLLLLASFAVGAANIGLEQMMGVSRLPVFLLGMAFGMDWPLSARRGWVRIAYGLSFSLGLAVVWFCTLRFPILLYDFGLYWYPFALITPPLCVGLAWLLHRAENVRAWFAPLRLLGQSSFEIYLINIWLVELAKKAGMEGAGVWLLLCAGNLVLGVGYRWLVERGGKACRAHWAARAAHHENINK